MIGYRAWFYYAERNGDAAMETKLDRDQYNENELISITIPLDNPYQLEQKSFQRAYGEITVGGKNFKYVKRKVSNGNLILLCISDTRKMILKKAKADYGSSSIDLTGTGKNASRNGLQKNYGNSDYIHQFANVPRDIYANESIAHSVFFLINLSREHVAAPAKPPQPVMA